MSNQIFIIMGKIALFNYFLSKVALKEQELLHVKKDRAALLAVIFSRMDIQHRHATGCSSEKVYLANPKYAEELFICVCLDAKQHGDYLANAFDFDFVPFYVQGTAIDDITDRTIAAYLDKEIYPNDCFDKELYAAVSGKDGEALDKMLGGMRSLWKRNVIDPNELMMPEPCAETAMIDRAWERLTADENFIKLLNPYTKYDRFTRSLAQSWYGGHINDIL